MTVALRPQRVPAEANADEAAIWAALAEVPDPEIPTISVVDLGIVRSVGIAPDRVRVEILPTFVGCPAIEMMRTAIADRLAGFRPTVEVAVSFAEPWTSDRISAHGRERLRAGGFAPPEPGPTPEAGPAADRAIADASRAPLSLIPLAPPARCPHCGSRRTRLENMFGPTLCRSIQYCLECRQPFEQFKTV
jgi:ring-1,2-phenylacetyl-CoA epoxidase subunit PaaD